MLRYFARENFDLLVALEEQSELHQCNRIYSLLPQMSVQDFTEIHPVVIDIFLPFTYPPCV